MGFCWAVLIFLDYICQNNPYFVPMFNVFNCECAHAKKYKNLVLVFSVPKHFNPSRMMVLTRLVLLSQYQAVKCRTMVVTEDLCTWRNEFVSSVHEWNRVDVGLMSRQSGCCVVLNRKSLVRSCLPV